MKQQDSHADGLVSSAPRGRTPRRRSARALAVAAGLAVGLGGLAPAAANWWDGYYIGNLVGLRIQLIGRDLNGVSMNGAVLDGRRLRFVELDGAEHRSGDGFEAVTLAGTRMVGITEDGDFAQLNGFKGAQFIGRLDDGDAVKLRIDEIGRDPAEHHKDVLYYQVSFETETGWQPLCGRDLDGEPVGAIPLRGHWDLSEGASTGGAHFADDDVFTFACDGHVLSHCVQAGYKPWRKAKVCREEPRPNGSGMRQVCEKVSLQALHQTCTRLVRADFCGDGVAHTEEGQPINYYDAFGVRIDGDEWAFEAEWGPDGARCMVEPRLASMVPACAAELQDPQCGQLARFASGTALMSEHPPASAPAAGEAPASAGRGLGLLNGDRLDPGPRPGTRF